jgi:hypothetical protein
MRPVIRAKGRSLANLLEGVLSSAVLCGLAGEINLYEQLDLAARRPSGFVEFRDQCPIVHRVNDVEPRPGFPGFVRLQVADQMPPDPEVGGLVHLLQRFLDLVFAEIDLARLGGRADVVGRKRF